MSKYMRPARPVDYFVGMVVGLVFCAIVGAFSYFAVTLVP